MRANLAVGLNCPVSIELIVFGETPTISASCDCESFFSNRASFNLFRNFSHRSSLCLNKPQNKKDEAEDEHCELNKTVIVKSVFRFALINLTR